MDESQGDAVSHADDATPWERLHRLVESSDAHGLDAYLKTLNPAETARAISRLSQEDQTQLLTLLSPADAADVLEDVSDEQAAELIDDLPPERAAAIVDAMESDQQADVLSELDAEEAEAVLQRMRPSEAEDVRRRLQYPADTAGGIMITEFVAYPSTSTVGDVFDDLRKHRQRYSDYDIQYTYVTSSTGVLLGVLQLRNLLFANPLEPITDVMRPDPVCVSAATPLEELQQLFAEHRFLGVPVTDAGAVLLGVVQSRAVQDAVNERAGRTFLAFSGIGREELRTLPLVARSSRRLSWLSINIVLNVLAASVIALYQETLARAVILAVFLPIISDMSGCSGNQAVAVSIRELTLGLVKPRELLHVFVKEISLGIVNGAALGALLGGVALLWQGNPYLGLVVGVSLALNTILAVALGGVLPLLLRRAHFDPALASGPILTTVTDMCGFLILLSLATALLPKIANP